MHTGIPSAEEREKRHREMALFWAELELMEPEEQERVMEQIEAFIAKLKQEQAERK